MKNSLGGATGHPITYRQIGVVGRNARLDHVQGRWNLVTFSGIVDFVYLTIYLLAHFDDFPIQDRTEDSLVPFLFLCFVHPVVTIISSRGYPVNFQAPPSKH